MILSIDIGGTAVKMGLVDEGGEVHARHEASVCFDGYRTPTLTTVMREAEAFLRRENAQVAGIGVSATGQVDDRAGVVIGTNGKIPGYEGSRIKEEMESRFHLPVWVLNDANAAALGECFAGAARGRRHVLMLTLGTGVGGGVVLGGELYGGARGVLRASSGHFTLYQDGAPCPCGKRGCLEHYAATTALVRRAQEATGEYSAQRSAPSSIARRGAVRCHAGRVEPHGSRTISPAGVTGLAARLRSGNGTHRRRRERAGRAADEAPSSARAERRDAALCRGTVGRARDAGQRRGHDRRGAVLYAA